MFNYYKRIAEYANELELDGNVKKAKQLREILRNENRCTFCGNITVDGGKVRSCSKCESRKKFNGKD